jgi:hypothetical protein
MTTYNHTPLEEITPIPATGATINAPLAELDTAIGNLDSLTTTAKDSTVEAINEVDAFLLAGGSVGGAVTVAGIVNAVAFVGDGSGLTGIGTGTGGVINTGSTTIGADSDEDGVGVIALQTRGVTRLQIENSGTITTPNEVDITRTNPATLALKVTGKVVHTANVTTAVGMGAANFFDMYAYDGDGTQWGNIFTRVYTVTGETIVAEAGGVYTCLYHGPTWGGGGFTLPKWKGVETGGAYVYGAGSVITWASGIEAHIPTCSDGGTVDTAAAVYLKSSPYTGITTVYPIYSDFIAASLFKGPLNVRDTGYPFEAWREGSACGMRLSVYQENATGGPFINFRFARGTTIETAADAVAGDTLGAWEFCGWQNGAFRLMARIQANAGTTLSPTSYAGRLFFRVNQNRSISAYPTIAMWINDNLCISVGTAGAPIYRMDVKGLGEVSVPVFTGTGLNDATSGITYTGFDLGTTTYTVVIDGTGAPDTFKWQKGTGSWTTGVAITGNAQTLTDGVTITFAATTGHNLTDQWVITVTPCGSLSASNAAGTRAFYVGNDTNVFMVGKITTYNNIATVGGGIPAEHALLDLTAQVATISATTLYAVPAAGVGMYRVSWVATITTAATTSCVLGGSTGFQLKYTDADDSVVKTTNPTTPEISATNATATSISGVLVAYCKASTNLQFLFGYTSVGGTPMAYNLHIVVEKL